MKRQREIKAVLFDIDDTLFDSTTLSKMARMNAIKAMIECGLPIRSVQKGHSLLMKIVEKYGSNYDKHFDRLLETLGCCKDPKIIVAGIVAYHDTKLAYIKPNSDVIPTLIALRDKGCKLGIVSNGRSVKQWEKLIRLGLHHFFDVVIVSEDVGSEKPQSKIFRVATEKLEVKPKETIYAGDDPETDVLGANNAGLISVGLIKQKRKWSTLNKDKQPKFTIKTVSELLSILEPT